MLTTMLVTIEKSTEETAAKSMVDTKEKADTISEDAPRRTMAQKSAPGEDTAVEDDPAEETQKKFAPEEDTATEETPGEKKPKKADSGRGHRYSGKKKAKKAASGEALATVSLHKNRYKTKCQSVFEINLQNFLVILCNSITYIIVLLRGQI